MRCTQAAYDKHINSDLCGVAAHCAMHDVSASAWGKSVCSLKSYKFQTATPWAQAWPKSDFLWKLEEMPKEVLLCAATRL